jgi:hypothetical protein
MRIGKHVTGIFDEQFDVICGSEQLIEDEVMT